MLLRPSQLQKYFFNISKNLGVTILYNLRLTSEAEKRTHAYPGLLIEKAETTSPDVLLNFGIRCPGSPNPRKFNEQNRDLEKKMQSLNGRVWLHAHMYFTEGEFWSIYDRGHHDALRAKWKTDYLPTINEKPKADYSSEKRAIQES